MLRAKQFNVMLGTTDIIFLISSQRDSLFRFRLRYCVYDQGRAFILPHALGLTPFYSRLVGFS
nr:MAG TPA: hypothetical protein [Siphoviridae sp. ctHdl3]